MPGQGRLGDKANVPADAHGCPGCPHPGIGPAINGSPNVNVNSRPALRVDDMGVHAACCGPNMWTAQAGSATVFINGKKAHRMGDATRHCGGNGQLIEGSANVIVGDSGGGGGGGGTSSSSGGGDGGAGGGGGGNTGQRGASGSSSGAASSGEAKTSDGSQGKRADPTADSPQPDQFILTLQMTAIGGGPLAREQVAIVDPDTGERVNAASSDDQGRIVVAVAEEKNYHVAIISDEFEVQLDDDSNDWPPDHEVATHLYCQFVDGDGEPLVGEKVKVSGEDASFDLVTGPDGEIEPAVDEGEYDVEVAGKKFRAHSLLVRDLHQSSKGKHYSFIVSDEDPDDDQGDSEDHERARLDRYAVSDEEIG